MCSGVGVKLRGHWKSTTRAPRAQAASPVRCQARPTSAVDRNGVRRYVGLEASCVISCQALA